MLALGWVGPAEMGLGLGMLPPVLASMVGVLSVLRIGFWGMQAARLRAVCLARWLSDSGPGTKGLFAFCRTGL